MRMINLLKLAIVGVVGITVACSISPEQDEQMEKRAEQTIDLKQKAEMPGQPVPDDVVRVKNDIWLGDTSSVEFEGEPVPSYLEAKDGITLISNRPITLFEIGSMINKITSLSVRYAPELEETVIANGDNNEPSMEDLGAQWTDSTRMLVNYKGPISGLLDEVANRFGVWWKYEKKEIDEAIRTKKLFHNTKEYNISKIIEQSAKPFAIDIVDNLINLSNDQLGSMQHLLLTGGGASILYPYIKEELNNIIEVSLIDNSEFSNASGYYKYGKLLKNVNQF